MGVRLRLPTVLLGVFGAWSLLVLVVVEAGLGERYSLHPEDPDLITVPPSLRLSRAESTLGALSLYEDVSSRPLFSDDRRPLPEAPVDAPAVVEAPPPTPLDLLLTSVIVRGETRIAQVTDRRSGASQAVKIGQSLAGEQSAWKLIELAPRSAVFEGPGGSSTIDLRVFDGQGGEPPTAPPVAPQPSVAPAQDGQTAAPAETTGGEQAEGNATPAVQATPEERAEMIRRRIEERRRQMREEAARASENKN